MSDNWEYSSPKEFLISADLYISTSAAATLRKPAHSQKKRADKRDSVRQSSAVGDERKIKEKSSWLSLAKGPSTAGNWRSVTCKLTEVGERSLLSIYLDESLLYQTLFIHLLHHTDIRHVHESMFLRKNCIGIYCIEPEQRRTSTQTNEPVFIVFSDSETCNTWLYFLRSYAIPEIYGKVFFPSDGGSYRMWRQVEMTIEQGRNLGNTRFYDSVNAGEMNTESDPVDLDVACEVYLNSQLCGRTTVKKGNGCPDWHENFTFSELPPFDHLEVVVYREKKLPRASAMGTVRIALNNFRRGETVDGWFPVLQEGNTACDTQVGDLRLKMRVDEEIILPLDAYSKLLDTILSRNFLDWMSDFENKLELKTVGHQLMFVGIAHGKLVENVQQIAIREVDGTTPSSHQTLFRGNTTFTKVMELCMGWYGKAFLEASIGPVLRRLCNDKVSIEVDPMLSGKGSKDIDRNMETLKYWCQEFWNQVYSVRRDCPPEMRQLFEIVRKLVEQWYYANGNAVRSDARELPWQSVSAFCFLRFIVPAILHPHLFGLSAGLPPGPVQRSLKLIAKVIQSLANLNSSAQKEDFMRGMEDFLKDNRQAMIDYLLVVSTPSTDGYNSSQGSSDDRIERLNITEAIREHSSLKPALDRESIPPPPYLLDIPRHLAILTSAVIRHSKDYFIVQQAGMRAKSDNDVPLNTLCGRCYDMEEQALQRVNFLATHIRPVILNDYDINSSVSPPPSGLRVRPSTAPSSTAEPERRRRNTTAESNPGSPRRLQQETAAENEPTSPPEHRHGRTSHLKSTSTDSVPYTSTNIVTTLPGNDSQVDLSDEAKRRRRFFRGIWRH